MLLEAGKGEFGARLLLEKPQIWRNRGLTTGVLVPVEFRVV